MPCQTPCVENFLILDKGDGVGGNEVEHQRYFDDVTARAENLVFNSPGCEGSNSYYIDKNGDTPFLRPFAGVRSTHMMRTAPKAYRLT